MQNPTLQNDAVANPSIVNAGVSNPSLQNPSLQNPSLQNPSLQNVDLTNAGFSDTSWVITNEGNTTASYTVNLLLNQPAPAGFATQLLLHKTFTTPAADGCALKEQAHTILLANIPNPQFYTDPANPSLQNPSLQNPSLQNPTLALGPGESATITLPRRRSEHFRWRHLRRLRRGHTRRRRAVGQHRGRGRPRSDPAGRDAADDYDEHHSAGRAGRADQPDAAERGLDRTAPVLGGQRCSCPRA